MKIIQITTDGEFNGRIFGLGSDGLVYLWKCKIGAWILYNDFSKNETSLS